MFAAMADGEYTLGVEQLFADQQDFRNQVLRKFKAAWSLEWDSDLVYLLLLLLFKA